MSTVDTTSSTAVATTKVSALTTDLFYVSLKNFIDYNKPDPIARRQLESWKMNWSESDNCRRGIAAQTCVEENENDAEPIQWVPKICIGGTLEIRGDYVAVELEMECIWADGDAAKNGGFEEDGRLYYTCRLKSGKFIDKKDDEEKTERKIRKKMISRLRKDSYITELPGLGEGNTSSTKLCLARASIYVNASKFELEERVDVSEKAAEILRRALWSSTTSSLDIVEVVFALPSLPCRSTDRVTTTTRLANRAKLRLLEDAMLDECEKEGDDQLIEDLTISKPTESSNQQQVPSNGPPTGRNKKRSKR